MFRSLARPVSALRQKGHRHLSTTATRSALRILFCGSDEFSCASLAALQRENVGPGRLVEALDVMVRPAKRTGRGLKQLRQGESEQRPCGSDVC